MLELDRSRPRRVRQFKVARGNEGVVSPPVYNVRKIRLFYWPSVRMKIGALKVNGKADMIHEKRIWMVCSRPVLER